MNDKVKCKKCGSEDLLAINISEEKQWFDIQCQSCGYKW